MEERSLDRAATVAAVRHGRRWLVKIGSEITRLNGPLSDAQLEQYLVHEDGLMRVPILVLDTLVVRGFTEALYREALGPRG